MVAGVDGVIVVVAQCIILLSSVDFDCKEETCRCLYDSGTLSNRNSGRFDRTSTRERGDGSIASTTRKRDFYCGSLVGMMGEDKKKNSLPPLSKQN